MMFEFYEFSHIKSANFLFQPENTKNRVGFRTSETGFGQDKCQNCSKGIYYLQFQHNLQPLCI